MPRTTDAASVLKHRDSFALKPQLLLKMPWRLTSWSMRWLVPCLADWWNLIDGGGFELDDIHRKVRCAENIECGRAQGKSLTGRRQSCHRSSPTWFGSWPSRAQEPVQSKMARPSCRWQSLFEGQGQIGV